MPRRLFGKGKELFQEQPTLRFYDLHWSRAFLVIVRDVIDSAADGVALHVECIVRLQESVDVIHLPHPRIEP